MLFHYPFLAPGASALAAGCLSMMRRDWKHLRTTVVAAYGLFAGVWAALVLLAKLGAEDVSLLRAFYPNAANPSGWVGFGLHKLAGLVAGVGNYFVGGQNFVDWSAVPAWAPYCVAVSWVYLALCLFGYARGFVRAHRSGAFFVPVLFFFGATFLVGQLQNLYSQPHNPQFQIQPMSITVVGLALLLAQMRSSLTKRAWALSLTLATLALTLSAYTNLRIFSQSRGLDGASLKIVRQLEEKFPKDQFILVVLGSEGWFTWVYAVGYSGDSEKFLAGTVSISEVFANQGGISAEDAASRILTEIEDARARGLRPVAVTVWNGVDADSIPPSVVRVSDPARARRYMEILGPAYRTGKRWETLVGDAVELLPPDEPHPAVQ